jgi:5-methylcytosine-specific restriction endonuclease McrA
VKTCEHCGIQMPQGKRPHARFCTRTCKGRFYHQNVRPKSTPEENAARYLKERERRLAYAKAYQKANPEVPQRAKRRRKALLTGNGVYQVSAKDWERELQRHGHKCAYCGCEGRLTMDHVIPASRGGTHSIGNLVPACKSCNSSKRDRTVMEWRMHSPSPRQRKENGADKRIRSGTSTASPDRADMAKDERRVLVSAKPDFGLGDY